MGIINILDAQTANLIAAGEVVERPSSAVKELLENAIDAGAKTISLEIRCGGRELIRVTDDGSGFLRDDIPKALLRHATSKISCGDDINGIKSLGFRGEALAAIGSVSRLEIITKSREEKTGTRLTSDENGIVMCDTGCPDGTTVTVRDIYFNTPARQKFLKKDGTEGASCVSVAEKIALSHPEISVSVSCDGERKFATSGDGKLKSAVYSVYGRAFALPLINIDYTLDGVTASGYISPPDLSRGSRGMQIFFVNGRYVKSKTVMAAFEEAFKSFLQRGKYPAGIIFVTLDEKKIDVNVHPAKTEIRFDSEKDVFHAVYYAVKNALTQKNEAPESSASASLNSESKRQFAAVTSSVHQASRTEVPSFREAVEAFKPDIGETDLPAKNFEFILRDSAPLPEAKPEPVAKSEPIAKSEPAEAEQLVFDDSPTYRVIGQAYDSYIFVQTDDSILVIDKHAAHERIIYEKLAHAKELHVQELLTGIPVNVGYEQASLLAENASLLAEKGFEIEDFGEGCVIVRSVPATLSGTKELPSLLEEFARSVSEGNGLGFAESCDRALYTVACKAALKAGIKNSAADDENIVDVLMKNPELKYCPHGRPFIKKLSKREIEKYFDR